MIRNAWQATKELVLIPALLKVLDVSIVITNRFAGKEAHRDDR